MKSYIRTINWGYVPIRKRYTDGQTYECIELSDNGTDECFAEIRLDDRTNQPFAVLFDKDWNQLYLDDKGAIKMKEMLLTYDSARKEFEALESGKRGIVTKYNHLVGMLLMMQKCGVMTEVEANKEMHDLQDIAIEKMKINYEVLHNGI